jgi:Mg2+ and Co2+ transporter CorA
LAMQDEQQRVSQPDENTENDENNEAIETKQDDIANESFYLIDDIGDSDAAEIESIWEEALEIEEDIAGKSKTETKSVLDLKEL